MAKIDRAEVRAPFVKASLLGFASAVVVIFLASLLFLRISTPMITHLQEQHAGLDAILETAVDGIITIDKQGVVESINPAAERMFGHAAEDVIGQNIKMLMPAPYKDEHDDYLAKYLQTGHKKIIGIGREVFGIRKDGSQFPLDLAVSEVRVGGRRFFTGIVRDITERKRAAQELATLNEELEDRVERRTRELKDAQDQLVRRERLALLGQLSGGMAHEIRNPLAVIKNAVYYLRETGDQYDEEAKECLHEIETEVKAANHIVTELLDYTREPKHSAEQFSLGEAVDRALKTTEIPDSIQVETNCRRSREITGESETKPNSHESDYSRESLGALWVSADRGQVERIVGNFLRNAVQAMPDGGLLTVTYGASNGEATVTVKDTGVGIAEEDVPQVFEALFTRKAKGIGLGLAISKRYAELNHGRLEVQSKLGEGSTFQLVLSLAGENKAEKV